MSYVIGIDEAGFGPNLGPLVISATAWQLDDGLSCEQLYDRLDGLIVDDPRRLDDGRPMLLVADSKRVYQPGKGLARLELGVLCALGLLSRPVDLWSELWDTLVPGVLPSLSRIPWYAQYDEPVPVDGEAGRIASLVAALLECLEAAGVRLIEVRSDAIFASRWNELLRLYNSKGAALSHRSIALAARVAESFETEPVNIVCDKHGGRNRYARLLGEYFPEHVIEIHGESRQRSTYRFGPDERRIECCFHARAESFLPVALASMTSKYLRELAMRAFNAFWLERVPDLRPTAGYPADAARFRDAIAAVQQRLGIDDGLIWRCR